MSKSNIFEHILYEMQMYLWTYNQLMWFRSFDDMTRLFFNSLFESHLLHLRNLIDFFNNYQNCINVNFLLTEKNNNFEVPNKNNQNKRIINKSIDHLTEARFKEATLKEKHIKLINNMYGIVPTKIKEWLNFILQTDKLKKEYKNMLNIFKDEINNFKQSMEHSCDLKQQNNAM